MAKKKSDGMTFKWQIKRDSEKQQYFDFGQLSLLRSPLECHFLSHLNILSMSSRRELHPELWPCMHMSPFLCDLRIYQPCRGLHAIKKVDKELRRYRCTSTFNASCWFGLLDASIHKERCMHPPNLIAPLREPLNVEFKAIDFQLNRGKCCLYYCFPPWIFFMALT